MLFTIEPPSVSLNITSSHVITKLIDEAVTFMVVITHLGLPEAELENITWVFNQVNHLESAPLESDGNIRISEDRLSIFINSLDYSNEGSYSIVLCNRAGCDSSIATLIVDGI